MRPSVCYVASYDPDYSRNLDVIRALRAAGVRVEVVQPRNPRHFNGSVSSPLSLLRSATWLATGTVLKTLDVGFRLLRCRALVVGYFGNLDMLTLAPIAKCLGRPVIFNQLVTFTDTLVEDRRIVDRRSVPAWLIGQLDRLALGLADLVLADTPENAEYVARLSGIECSRLLVMPVGADETVFFPAKPEVERPAGELDVLYYGKFIPLHGVEAIIRAAALLQAEHPGIHFELIGTGQEHADARELAQDLNLANIRWTDWLPYSGLGRRLREADVALGIFDGGGKAARVIPNKVHQALACGVPVVTRASPAVARLLVDRQSARLVPPDDPEARAAALIELASDPQHRREIGRAGRAVWESYASNERLAALAREALERVGVRV